MAKYECICWKCDKACDSRRCPWVNNNTITNDMKVIKYGDNQTRVIECGRFEESTRNRPVNFLPGAVGMCEEVLHGVATSYYNDVVSGKASVHSKRAVLNHWIWEILDPLGTGKAQMACKTIEAKAIRRREAEKSIDKIFRAIILSATKIEDLYKYYDVCRENLAQAKKSATIQTTFGDDNIDNVASACLKEMRKADKCYVLQNVADKVHNRIKTLSSVGA